MGELLIRLGELGIGFLSMMGPLVLLMVFLKLRDQRESTPLYCGHQGVELARSPGPFCSEDPM